MIMGKIVIAFLVIISFAAGLFIVPKALNYVSENPLMCGGCHIMEPAVVGFVKSAHYGKAKCVDCHKDTIMGKMRRIGKTVFLDPRFVSRPAEVPKEKCIKCHKDRLNHMTDKCGICHTPSGIPHRWSVPHN
ncbi:MAG: hypothetical protein US76_04125 [Parcubacteria group bacterium GW2011_GWA2_38_13b]|nr:MAG: hypothetical protein US76_04125 [Parcubacteria group bacterium GW2011_GWA2_38_13b]